MKTYLIIVVLFLFFLIVFLYHEKQHIDYHISCLIHTTKNKKGLPTPAHVIRRVQQIVNLLPISTFTFIDFGCGDGTIITHMLAYVRHIIGIEIDEEQARQTQLLFSNLPSVTIKKMDILDYSFENIPTVFYMYEPLWTMTKEDAIPIYTTVMDHISIIDECYIIYISGVRSLLDEEFFKKYPFTIIYHSTVKRGLGWNGNQLYVLHKTLYG